MQQPKITLIVIQRERFCLTKMSLDSILSDRSYPFDLIYVDGGSPAHIQSYLQEQANSHDFIKLIRQERYLSVNEARNLALAQVDRADYVVFLDNDVTLEKGWLKLIVDCAQEEDADIVAPLVLEGDPKLPEKIIHIAGVLLKPKTRPSGKRSWEIRNLLHHAKLANHDLKRQAVDVVEFHCTLVRSSLFERISLDLKTECLNDYVDLCLDARAVGAKILFEPKAVVTFLNPLLISGFDRDDLRFHQFRWSEKAVRNTLTHAQQKWGFEADDPFIWGFWRWAIGHRQMPIKWATSEKSMFIFLLKFCKLRLCPSWLRVAIEKLALYLTFPKKGIPCNLTPTISVSDEKEKAEIERTNKQALFF
jgi:GT2 family glycosyltransferase